MCHIRMFDTCLRGFSTMNQKCVLAAFKMLIDEINKRGHKFSIPAQHMQNRMGIGQGV